jgi:hypothetical protein
MPQEPARSGRVAAVCSFVCLGAQAVWLALCYLFATRPSPEPASAENVVEGWLAVLGAMIGAFVGVCLLSAVGVAFGVAGRRSGCALLALLLNAVMFLGTSVPMLLLLLTPKTQ